MTIHGISFFQSKPKSTSAQSTRIEVLKQSIQKIDSSCTSIIKAVVNQKNRLTELERSGLGASQEGNTIRLDLDNSNYKEQLGVLEGLRHQCEEEISRLTPNYPSVRA